MNIDTVGQKKDETRFTEIFRAVRHNIAEEFAGSTVLYIDDRGGEDSGRAVKPYAGMDRGIIVIESEDTVRLVPLRRVIDVFNEDPHVRDNLSRMLQRYKSLMIEESAAEIDKLTACFQF